MAVGSVSAERFYQLPFHQPGFIGSERRYLP
jgi:hypothetical protein